MSFCYDVADQFEKGRFTSNTTQLADSQYRRGIELFSKLETLIENYTYSFDDHTTKLTLLPYSLDELDYFNQCLGEGDVSAKLVTSDQHIQLIQETHFIGVWRVIEYDPQQIRCDDYLMVAPIPPQVWQQAYSNAKVMDELPPHSEDCLNGAVIAQEILAKITQVENEHSAFSVNFTLLPVGPADKIYLDALLVEGYSGIFSRGYGKCRILSTQLPYVWRVQYFNEMNILIQDGVEISKIPAVSLAAAEDIEDSKIQIQEYVLWLKKTSSKI